MAETQRKNTYITTHIYPGAGKYTVFMQDQNRNAGVKNIPNSDNVWFYIESEIVIDLNSGGNSAPRLQNPPIDIMDALIKSSYTIRGRLIPMAIVWYIALSPLKLKMALLFRGMFFQIK